MSILHRNYQDPHPPYRTPMALGEPFTADPVPEAFTEAMRHRSGEGFQVGWPGSADRPTVDTGLHLQYDRAADCLEAKHRVELRVYLSSVS